MNEPKRKSLSSAQTMLMKFFFSPLWIGLFGAGTVAIWIDALDDTKGSQPGDVKWIFLLVWIVGSTMIWLLSVRIKRIEIDDSNLYISNYLREVSVPFDQIETVTEIRWTNPRQVIIHLRADTGFGRVVRFIPKVRFLGLFSAHPVVSDLLGLAGMPT